MLRYVLFNDLVHSYAACVDISDFLNPLSLMSDQKIISPYNIEHRSDENKEKATTVSVPIGFPCVCKQFFSLNWDEFSCKISLNGGEGCICA